MQVPGAPLVDVLSRELIVVVNSEDEDEDA